MNKKLILGLVAGTAVFAILVRLAHRWGANDFEVGRSFPGDKIIPKATTQTTHAVTVRAPAEAIWPWLVQAGYHRGGWYGNPTLDRLFDKYLWQVIVPPEERAEYRPSAEQILPEFQDLQVGDTVHDGPPGTVFFTVKEMQANRHLVLYSDSHYRYSGPAFLRGTRQEPQGEFTWAFILDEVSSGNTRLILRTRFNHGPLWFRIAGWPLLLFGEALFPYQILNGLKLRVEQTIA